MATATAKKIEMFPDEVFLRAAIKDGRAVKKELSLKAIGVPDTRLQQRVEMNVDHVRKLERILHDDGNLRPIIVFEEQEPYKLHVADGFHRHAAHKNARRDSIWAWVIQGTYRDAMIYSTMCNQDMCLKRTPEDIKKAVWTLLDDEEWRGKSDQMIGNHCGLSHNAVTRCRLEHSVDRGVPIPERVETSAGRSSQYRRLRNGPSLTRQIDHSHRANLGGKKTYLPRDPAEAQAAVDAFVAAKAEQKRTLDPCAVRNFLCRHDLLFRSNYFYPSLGLGSVSEGHGVVFVTEELNRHNSGAPSPAVPSAVGRVLLARQMIDPTARAVVVCYVEDAPPELIEAGRALGVEFLTPEELVASLKPESEVEADSQK